MALGRRIVEYLVERTVLIHPHLKPIGLKFPVACSTDMPIGLGTATSCGAGGAAGLVLLTTGSGLGLVAGLGRLAVGFGFRLRLLVAGVGRLVRGVVKSLLTLNFCNRAMASGRPWSARGEQDGEDDGDRAREGHGGH